MTAPVVGTYRVVCTRAYEDGTKVFVICRSVEEVEEWKLYSLETRRVCALFVGTECIQRGYLNEERCAQISKELENA